jgi:hypothetical protein
LNHPVKIQAVVKLLKEIEGYGDPIADSDRFNAVLKFYRNKEDPLEFDTVLQDPVPYVEESDGAMRIAWSAAKLHRSHVDFERDAVLARQADMLPGIYYAMLGMRTMGYNLWPYRRTFTLIRCIQFTA